MRWPAKKEAELGDSRIVRKFMWFQKKLQSTEYRWLEMANIEERSEWELTIFGDFKIKLVEKWFV